MTLYGKFPTDNLGDVEFLDKLPSPFGQIPSGWLVNNCYQHDDGRWRMNLRRPNGTGDWFTDWAEGETLEEALEECISKLHDAEFTHDPKTNYSIEEAPKISLAGLGLRKREPIRRRI